MIRAVIAACAVAAAHFAQAASPLWTVDATGWRYERRETSDIYHCQVCEKQVEIQATSWPLTGVAANTTPAQFVTIMSDERARRSLAEQAIRQASRDIPVPNVKIESTRLSKLAGIDVVEYRATLSVGKITLRELATLGVHRGSVVKTSVVYVDRELSVTERAAVNGWMRALAYK